MPAHDEELGIVASIESIRPQLRPGDRFLVVADNCSDQTARVAREAGAEVIERSHATQRGKGYALDFGVRHLAQAPTEQVVILDADCTIAPDCLDRLSDACVRLGRPMQALYLMHAPAEASLRERIAAFAWVVKNQARALGTRALGMPCQLMGTGMAFPWAVIESAPLASGHVVEDMELGLALALRGQAPVFCGEALVESSFPEQAAGVASQRKRWEHGHLGIIMGRAPALLVRALSQGRVDAVFLVLDLCVPPLAFFALVLAGTWLGCAVFGALSGSAEPLVTVSVALLFFASGVAAAWAKFGRHVVSLRELAGVPLYILSKIPLYLGLFRRKQVEWVRTKRDDEN